MKKLLVLFIGLFFSITLQAQIKKLDTANVSRKIGLFVPLYLDSIFKAQQYRYGKKFPRFTLQGLEFYQGAKIALDSFSTIEPTIELFVYDNKSDSLSVDSIISTHKHPKFDLIIGAVKDEDLLSLANYAKSQKIPFVSATLPNDEGISNNPYFIILNPTLKTHCESIFSYLLQNHSSDHIVLIQKSGNQEDRVVSYFTNINEQDSLHLLEFQSIKLDSNYNSVSKYLDSTKKNIIIGASLDENFTINLATSLKSISKTYEIMLIGMPNWNGFNAFGKNSVTNLKDFPVFFTSSYYNDKTDSISDMIQNAYLINYKGKPGEFTYKGFETMYYFSKLHFSGKLDNLLSELNDSKYAIFSEYHFLPAINNKTKSIDYFENKHLFFLKKINGRLTKMN